MDVKIAFLNKNLHEDVYKTQLEGFESKIFYDKYASYKNLFMDLRKLQRVVILVLMR
jgi:hypothetical protein